MLRPKYVGSGKSESLRDDPFAYFIERLAVNSSKLVELDNIDDAPTRLRDFWQKDEVYIAQDDKLRSLPWRESGYQLLDYQPVTEVAQGAVMAKAAIAESGTLMVTCSPASPSGLNFLPHSHCIFLHHDDLYPYFEDLPAEIYHAVKNGDRGKNTGAINFITGPSHTADIEQTLLLGAHGPAELIIVVYNS